MPRRLYVFGSNGEGQLGIPAADIVSTPTLVPNPLPLNELKAIRCGDNHTLVMINNGTLYGAGDNRKGQLAPQFEEETRFDGFKNLERGGSIVAASCETTAYCVLQREPASMYIYSGVPGQLRLTEPGEMLTWIVTGGSGQWGELGRGENITRLAGKSSKMMPIASTLPGTIIELAAGVWHYVAIFEDGSVYGWGKARLGQLGDKLSGKVMVPTKIEDIPFQPRKVVCGKDFTYLVGESSTGEHILLGRDKFNIVSGKPSDIKGWKDIGATWHAIFILFEDGRLTAWGKGNIWQLLPPNLPLIEKIAVGSDHILALTKDGKLLSWGWGKHGNCGDLSKIEHEIKYDMVSGLWNEIDIPGEIEMIAAGYCTSFVVTKLDQHQTNDDQVL